MTEENVTKPISDDEQAKIVKDKPQPKVGQSLVDAIKTVRKVPGLEEMLKAGVHFGHRTSKWNAKMEPYIFTIRNNVHIIDLERTQEKLKDLLKFLAELKKDNKIILFVGTKVAVKEITKQSAVECKMPYVTERWIGGTLTNFESISERLKHFRDLEDKKKTGELAKYTKKEQHDFGVELQKLERQFGGIKKMTKLPDVLFVIDVHKEGLAVKEARTKKIPIIGICDTNADPTKINHPVPANDDAISSLKLILGTIVSALK